MKRTEQWLMKNCCFKQNTRLADFLPIGTGATGLPSVSPEKDEKGKLKQRRRNEEVPLNKMEKENLRTVDELINLEMAKEIMDRYPNGLSYLGVGARGLATKIRDMAGKWMESKNLGKVLKITFDPGEAAVAKSQVNDKLKSMVKVYSVEDIKAVTTVPAWMIEAEEVFKLDDGEKEVVSLLIDNISDHKKAEDIYDGEGEFRDSYRHITNRMGFDNFWRRNEKRLYLLGYDSENRSDALDVWNKWTKMMNGLMTKWTPMDASGLNVGKRESGEYVLLDLGME